MAVIFTNAAVIISTCSQAAALGSSYDISTVVTQVDINRTYDIHDKTVMGQTSHAVVTGLEKWKATVTVLQTFSTADEKGINVDQLIAKLVDIGSSGSSFTIAIRPSNAARSCSNPEYTGPVILSAYDPMKGKVGDLLVTALPFESAGNISRFVSSS